MYNYTKLHYDCKCFGLDEYNKYVDICYVGTLTHTRTREPLYLRDKPIMRTLEGPNEGYDPNYTGAP